ncbi:MULTISPECIES: hypothetical protein [Burkholderia]|uniref:hypothetical protein n=1 Tax=Burkholderia TaxID=32008 RepID=UPI00075B5CC2|nr:MULTISPECIES: hypothetical protein [Burkholderia]AOJ73466.1 hypothetical protein WS78_31925 [Burkholderia savannae]KVG41392.1 hypothetical protein WS77_17265 [Burkholderia sp. MSMB0265]KVG87911.1 hypothetical protein WS81_25600 [Burkholderia sp. MSMB2040]KVG96482.1 hypothetical protein WS82_32100 [Burkholderia sp. MSMB2041]KVH01629.1 hypothetical protein WS83_18155 [Burkholderia sp. MSMB2042]
MKLPIRRLKALLALALSIASLSGCNRDAESMPAANVDAGASASRGWPIYMEEFNESIRSMSGEHKTGVYINRGWGVFNTAKTVPSTDSAPAPPTDASGTHLTPLHAHRSNAPAANSQLP